MLYGELNEREWRSRLSLQTPRQATRNCVSKSLILFCLCLIVVACANPQPPSNTNQRPEVTSTGVVKATPLVASVTRGESTESIIRLKTDDTVSLTGASMDETFRLIFVGLKIGNR